MSPTTAGAESARALRAALWPVTRALTCDDLWRIREASAERLEIIDGELLATPSSTPMHQVISGRLSFEFDRAVVGSHLGQVFSAMLDVRLATDTVVLPDILIILRDRFATMTDWGIDGLPSLLAEITSTHTEYRDRALKPEIYALFDVPEYWLVELEDHHVRICSDPRDGRYQAERTASDVVDSVTIPGLKVDLAKIFAPIFGD